MRKKRIGNISYYYYYFYQSSEYGNTFVCVIWALMFLYGVFAHFNLLNVRNVYWNFIRNVFSRFQVNVNRLFNEKRYTFLMGFFRFFFSSWDRERRKQCSNKLLVLCVCAIYTVCLSRLSLERDVMALYLIKNNMEPD